MSSISALSNWQPAVRYQPPPTTARSTVSASAAASPSSVVKLSPEALAAAAEPQTTAERYKDLGAAMLKQFSAGAAIPVSHDDLPASLDNQFTLSVTTRSGAKVELTLGNVDDEMVFQMSASKDLSDDERKALSDLAAGFQTAIDGLSQGDPQIRLSALTQADSKFLQSVDLHAEVKQSDSPPATQTLDFHIEGTQRKVSLDGPAGKAEVNIDTSKLENIGTKEQQTKAINGYLKQFDQAALRGHGDAKLMTMFKDAFSDMSRTSGRAEAVDAGLSTEKKWSLSSEDHAVLTGLADFSASVTQTPKFINPAKPAEKDSFSYDVSQNTSVSGKSRDERQIAQSQQSHLSAQYHDPLQKNGALKLDLTPQSQNYEYREINDSANSTVELGYKDGRLVRAQAAQSVSQSEHIRTYMLGKVKSDNTIPGNQYLVRDLMASLAPYHTGDYDTAKEESSAARDDRRQGSLDALSDKMLLLSSPYELAERDKAW